MRTVHDICIHEAGQTNKSRTKGKEDQTAARFCGWTGILSVKSWAAGFSKAFKALFLGPWIGPVFDRLLKHWPKTPCTHVQHDSGELFISSLLACVFLGHDVTRLQSKRSQLVHSSWVTLTNLLIQDLGVSASLLWAVGRFSKKILFFWRFTAPIHSQAIC